MRTFKDWKQQEFQREETLKHQSGIQLQRQYRRFLSTLSPEDSAEWQPISPNEIGGGALQFGKVLGGVWLLLLLILVSNVTFGWMGSKNERAFIPFLSYAWLAFGLATGICAWVAGAQRGRPVLGFFAFLFSPIGFLVVLSSDPKLDDAQYKDY